jgi:hypothetical protein
MFVTEVNRNGSYCLLYVYVNILHMQRYLYYISLKWPLSCVVMCCVVLFGIGGQTARPIGLKIDTHTHWNYAMKIGGSAIASAQSCARKCARSTTYPA